MCCSPAATKGAARAVPVVLGEAPKDVVASSTSQRHRSGRPSTPSAARPLAVRRPAPAPRHAQKRVSREDLDCVRIALEQELAAGAPLSDEDIVEGVSSSTHPHPLIVSIGECFFFRALCSRVFFCRAGRRLNLSTEALQRSDWRLVGRRVGNRRQKKRGREKKKERKKERLSGSLQKKSTFSIQNPKESPSQLALFSISSSYSPVLLLSLFFFFFPVLSKLREQNPAFFASYDARKRENSTAMTLTTTATATATPSVSTSTAMLTSSGEDASLRPTNSSSSSEEEDDGGDDEGRCNNDIDRRDGSSSEDDAVVPLFA